MNKTPAQRSTGVERQPEPYCIHDIRLHTGRECAICARNADARDPEFMSEFGGEQGFDYYGELGMARKGWK